MADSLMEAQHLLDERFGPGKFVAQLTSHECQRCQEFSQRFAAISAPWDEEILVKDWLRHLVLWEHAHG